MAQVPPEKAAGYPSWSWKVISRLENFTSCCMMQSRTASNPSYPPSGNRRVINAFSSGNKACLFHKIHVLFSDYFSAPMPVMESNSPSMPAAIISTMNACWIAFIRTSDRELFMDAVVHDILGIFIRSIGSAHGKAPEGLWQRLRWRWCSRLCGSPAQRPDGSGPCMQFLPEEHACPGFLPVRC